MYRLFSLLLGLLFLLTACGPSPVGDWQGTQVFLGDDGSNYINEMSVDKGGEASGTLYFTGENPDYEDDSDEPEFLIFYIDFEAEWTMEKGTAEFEIECTNCDPTYPFDMSCEFEDPGMACGADPDFYADDSTYLQWEEAD